MTRNLLVYTRSFVFRKVKGVKAKMKVRVGGAASAETGPGQNSELPAAGGALNTRHLGRANL